MDVVLVTARSSSPAAHWSWGAAGVVAQQLADAGHRVQWLCPVAVGAAVPAVAAGVTLQPVPGRCAPYRRVIARISDTALDVALARALRPLRRGVVAHIGFGAAGSCNTLWIAERMGLLPVAAVLAVEALCHRGTLVDATGARCAQFLDAARCAECACAPWAGGLSARQGTWARWLRRFGGWSPFPGENGFLSRADLLLASLQLATVVVADVAQGELLLRAGVGERALRVVGAATTGADQPPASAGIAAAIGELAVATARA